MFGAVMLPYHGKVSGEPRCANCGYVVKGLLGCTCPECGANLRRVGVRTGKNPVLVLLQKYWLIVWTAGVAFLGWGCVWPADVVFPGTYKWRPTWKDVRSDGHEEVISGFGQGPKKPWFRHEYPSSVRLQSVVVTEMTRVVTRKIELDVRSLQVKYIDGHGNQKTVLGLRSSDIRAWRAIETSEDHYSEDLAMGLNISIWEFMANPADSRGFYRISGLKCVVQRPWQWMAEYLAFWILIWAGGIWLWATQKTTIIRKIECDTQ